MRVYIVAEAYWVGSDATIFSTREEAQGYLKIRYNEAQIELKAHPETMYIEDGIAEIKTECVEDMWFGQIIEYKM